MSGHMAYIFRTERKFWSGHVPEMCPWGCAIGIGGLSKRDVRASSNMHHNHWNSTKLNCLKLYVNNIPSLLWWQFHLFRVRSGKGCMKLINFVWYICSQNMLSYLLLAWASLSKRNGYYFVFQNGSSRLRS